MKVVDTYPVTYEQVEIEGGEWTCYRRIGPDSWEVLMGEAWEPLYNCGEEEAAYQEFKKSR